MKRSDTDDFVAEDIRNRYSHEEGESGTGRRKVMGYCLRNLLYILRVYIWSRRSSSLQKQLWYHDAVLFPPAALFIRICSKRQIYSEWKGTNDLDDELSSSIKKKNKKTEEQE